MGVGHYNGLMTLSSCMEEDAGSIPVPPTLFSGIFIMTDQEIFELYKLQSINVRKLSRVQKILNKDINLYFRKSDIFQINIKTKLLALLYCAWSEAQFVQIVYTPRGFSSSEIDNIKMTKNRDGITDGWKQMIELSLKRVGNWEKNSALQNTRKKLFEIVDEYIKEPSLLRNKIAHGQWFVALNRENTAKNEELSKKLDELDVISITKSFEVHKYLGYIIRDLVQSPKRGFHKNYWVNLTFLEEYMNKTKKWDIQSKKNKLLLRPIQQA